MEVIGFLVALVFLIPTYGISLLVYLAVLVGVRVMRANVRMHASNMHGALREVRDASVQPDSTATASPAWFDNKDEFELFVSVVVKLCARSNIPAVYVAGLLAQADFLELLRNLVAGFEKRGSSFMQQQMGAAEFIEMAWNRLSEENQSLIRRENERFAACSA